MEGKEREAHPPASSQISLRSALEGYYGNPTAGLNQDQGMGNSNYGNR